MDRNRPQSTKRKSRLFPVDQMSRDSVVTPKDFITETTTVAMIPEAKPTL